jgi:hypothetical protein
LAIEKGRLGRAAEVAPRIARIPVNTPPSPLPETARKAFCRL